MPMYPLLLQFMITPLGWLMSRLLKDLRTSSRERSLVIRYQASPSPTAELPIGPTVDPPPNHDGVIGYLPHALTLIRRLPAADAAKKKVLSSRLRRGRGLW